MRLTSIQLHGFRRFSAPQTLMVENKVIALVGPNEAGKTSVLDALGWLNPDATGIPQDQFSRQVAVDSNQHIIEAKFRLTTDDLDLLSGLPNLPKILRIFRTPFYPNRHLELDTSSTITEEMSQDIVPRLSAHIPFFLKLHPDERKLEIHYHLRNIPPRPNAIHNLFSLGGVELSELAVDFQNGNLQSVRTKLLKAQRKITEVLKQRWTASNLEIQLRHESEFVYIDIVNSINHDVVDIRERSEGFQWFLCVIAALEGVRTNTSHPAILLIDEADNHLHYEAQAKLANFLSHQTLAQHVIYTTHSPGCLPDDLSAVRAVIPSDDNTSSCIESRVWNGKGKDFKRFFWLLGAKSFAFTAARNVLITEGEADFVLLPYLFREALGAEALNFQILPGLANAKEKDSFELEAVTVAYLVDGDGTGDKYKKELIEKGVSENRIFQFEKDLALEDYLNLDLYSQAVNQELNFARSGLKIDHVELEKPNRSAIVSKFAKQNGVEVSKRSVAEVFLTLQNELDLQERLIATDRLHLVEIAKSLAELFGKTKYRA